jgi:hypothetical protein
VQTHKNFGQKKWMPPQLPQTILWTFHLDFIQPMPAKKFLFERTNHSPKKIASDRFSRIGIGIQQYLDECT